VNEQQKLVAQVEAIDADGRGNLAHQRSQLVARHAAILLA